MFYYSEGKETQLVISAGNAVLVIDILAYDRRSSRGKALTRQASEHQWIEREREKQVKSHLACYRRRI